MSLQPVNHRRNATQFNTITVGGSKNNEAQKQLVNFSVRAQDFILKKGLAGAGSYHKNSQSTIDVEDIAIGIGNSGPHSNINNFLDESIVPSMKTLRTNF